MEMDDLVETKNTVLKLRILYDIDNPNELEDPDEARFKIIFIPFIGNDTKRNANVTKSFKFYLNIKRDITQIYQFYENIRADKKFRAAVTSTIIEPLGKFRASIPGKTTKERLEALGLRIYRELFPLEIREIIKQYSISTIVINSNNFMIPFELMHDGSSFLATKLQFYRKPIIEDKEKENIKISNKARDLPNKVVFFTNPTGDLQEAEHETSQIINFFESNELKDLDLQIENYPSQAANYDALSYIFYMPRLDIFHYSGHSKITKKDISFLLKRDSFSVNDLSLVYPTLFFLNMCEGDVTVKQKVAFSGYEALNFPMRVLKKGAKACVATIWPIIDKTAAEFAIEFYNQLIKGESFGKAICRGKEHLESISNPDDITWMSFILYGDPEDAHLEDIGIKKSTISDMSVIKEKGEIEKTESEPQIRVSEEVKAQIKEPILSKEQKTLHVGFSENDNLLSVNFTTEKLGAKCEVLSTIKYNEKDLETLMNSLKNKISIDKNLRKVEELINIGYKFYSQLFPVEIQRKIESSDSKTLEIFLDSDLQKYPWELFHDGTEFLGLKYSISRYFNLKEEDLQLPQRGKKSREGIKFLFIGDPTNDLPDAGNEASYLNKKLSKIKNIKTKLLVRTDASSNNVIKELKENYDFIHYCGHLHFNLDDPVESGLILSDRVLKSSEIMKEISENPPILGFFNTCHSCREQTWSKASMKFIFQNQVCDLASSFFKNGVNFIGTQWDVPENVAKIASLNFYYEFIKGNSLGESLRKTRAYINDYKDWSFEDLLLSSNAYSLYGDPTLFIAKKD